MRVDSGEVVALRGIAGIERRRERVGRANHIGRLGHNIDILAKTELAAIEKEIWPRSVVERGAGASVQSSGRAA